MRVEQAFMTPKLGEILFMAQYVFSTFAYPGAPETVGAGVNDAGEVVGSYSSAGGSGGPAEYGFTYSGGVFTPISYPASPDTVEQTLVTGISSSGELVGYTENVDNDFNALGFTETNGTFTALPIPSGSGGSYPAGINPAGTEVVGTYQEGRYDVGFTYTSEGYMQVSYPGYGTANPEASVNSVTGISATGELVGYYGYSPSALQGFFDIGGTFTSIAYPDATSTTPAAVNASGEIVGSYVDASGNTHGFVDMGGVFSSVDVPGATSTSVNEINDEAELVGSDEINGVLMAFTAVPAVCFCSGTRVATVRESKVVHVEVQNLRIGDLVVTSSGINRPVRWLGHRSVSCGRHPRPQEVWPIRIVAHAFGEARPSRDLLVSPGHAICVDVFGEVLIPASALVNTMTITQEPVASVTYWHVELDTHDILVAENLPAESYLEMRNRHFFMEAPATALHPVPDAGCPDQAGFCRRIYQEGIIVESVLKRLAERAIQLGWTHRCTTAIDRDRLSCRPSTQIAGEATRARAAI